MMDFEKIVLAALLHDFDKLPAHVAKAVAPLGWQGAGEDAVGALIVDQAESYCSAVGEAGAPLAEGPLVSIFSHVRLEHDPDVWYQRVGALAATTHDQAHLFPVEAPADGDLSRHHDHFAKTLEEIVGAVAADDFERLYSHLLASMQRYLWCLPAHTDHVSLFDHLKITSAAAAALYRYHQARDTLSDHAISEQEAEDRFCLLVGDLSGIQEYIFDIASIGAGGVARRLRARSFFISLVSDVVAHKTTRDFEVPLGNVIMSSGGKFYVLLPRPDNIEDLVGKIQQEVDRWLLTGFNGEIRANLAYASLSGEQFQASTLQQRGFGDVIAELSLTLARSKQRPLHHVLKPDWGADTFVIQQDYGGEGACASCGKFPREKAGEFCSRCSQDAALGGMLPKVRYVAYYDGQTGSAPKGIELLGEYAAAVLTDVDPDEIGAPYLVVKLNDPQVSDLYAYPGGFRYLANHVPTGEDGTPLSFDEIARGGGDGAEDLEEDVGEPGGRALLGHVKADVDHLGIIVAQGLREDGGGHDTISHTAMLSRQLDLFFSGWLEHILDTPGAQYRNFYTVFSGGDDLFLVGRWNEAAQLAMTVNDGFKKFVGHNDDVTLSAGILFAKDRYPIARAAGDVDDALRCSKERVGADGRSRNQLTVLNDTLTWEEARRVWSEIETLSAHAGGLTSALLHNLVQYGQLYRQYKAGDIEGLRYKALFAWNIARVLRQADPAVRQWADELMQSLGGKEGARRMEHLDLEATYLLFSRRGA